MTTATSATLESLQSEIKTLRGEISYLKEQNEWFRRQCFGKRSEKIVADLNDAQLTFENFDLSKEEPEEKKNTPAHQRKTSKRKEMDKITISPDLPVERHVLDIPEEDKVCKETGNL